MVDEITQRLALRIELDPRINFASQQNDVPIVKALHVDNTTDEPLEGVEVEIQGRPDFCRPYRTTIERIPENGTYTLDAVDLQPSGEYLAKLTERIRAELVISAEVGEDRAAEIVEQVELLARNEWGGQASLPELLAAFVMPNHPRVQHLLRDAADLLGEWTGDPSLSGYQAQDRTRVLQSSAAIYAAMQRSDITYVNPPASFEQDGQRIRLPDVVEATGMATCLDVAVLAAACLEQAGLNAIVVMVKGHAFTGVWLDEESFAEPAMFDLLRLRKRVDLEEILVFDPTGVTSRPSLSFENAIAEARRRLKDDDDELCAIDVCRARKARIRPLPERAEEPQVTTSEQEGETSTLVAPPAVTVLSRTEQQQGPSSPAKEEAEGRLDRWKRRLLDLTLRNRLLNFKDTRKTLPLLSTEPSRLEDLLSEGTSFQILARPDELQGQDGRDPEAHRRRTGVEGLEEVVREELTARRLHCDVTEDELGRRLIEIYRAARDGLEEGGASALYLAVGFLSWYETDRSEQRRLAPLLLVPVRLNRKSVNQGFSLEQGEDEPRFNVTLLELLKQDFGLEIDGLDPLPTDESGLDVDDILRRVRHSIRDIDRWDVLGQVSIGLFSFSKFLMWRDLSERTEDLLLNPVVDHLVNRPEEAFPSDGEFPRPETLDQERHPKDTYCPLPADSSQLAAVFAAAEGRNFVLEGPPGTGKSQTIANLIAHCLAEGKRVLFVSEKMAALNVVHRRLSAVGLERFCLELHSNKAQKSGVISQLAEGLEKEGAAPPDVWERESDRLNGLRSELNAYANALHQRRDSGETFHQAMSRLIGLRGLLSLELSWPPDKEIDADTLERLRDIAEQLATAATALVDLGNHPWRAVHHQEWTPDWENQVRRAVVKLSEAIDELRSAWKEVGDSLGVVPSFSLNDIDSLRRLAQAMFRPPAVPANLVSAGGWDEVRTRLDGLVATGRTRDQLRAQLQPVFTERVTSLQLEALQIQLRKADGSFWPLSWWRRRPILSMLAPVATAGTVGVEGPALQDAITTAIQLRDEHQALQDQSEVARSLLGSYWRDGEPDWEQIETVRGWAEELREVALKLSGTDVEKAKAYRSKWGLLIEEGHQLLEEDGEIGRQLIAFREAIGVFHAAREGLMDLLSIDEDRAWGGSFGASLDRMEEQTRLWASSIGELRAWCAWCRVRSAAIGEGLSPVVEALEHGAVLAGETRGAFERGFAEWWTNRVISGEPILRDFFSPEHERRIAQFRTLDDDLRSMSIRVIQSKLDENVPNTSAADMPNSEVGVLRREAGKKRRLMSVRNLFQKLPNLLPRLKPCLLMSPMSVAQYLDASHAKFDLVVFDEASQIPVWDAVGAIARGKQAVIVGDPKQLPPTSFFERQDDDGDGDGAAQTEDLESILDECIGAQIPWLRLNWHYRSRHESLIAFSNYHYYDNRLLTFPSPIREGMGVSWTHVPKGVYDKGKSRTNREEARAVVDEVVQRLKDGTGHSVGVVTFSEAQQTLIEDLLDQARTKDDSLEQSFSEAEEEPVFVKNLENVQGDERDIILFSICYGPDRYGKVAMNFGPMNREGGERRLNVAITRARRAVRVFSTLRADQIDLARSRAKGVAHLKNFLEYAERGIDAIAQATILDHEAEAESPFEEEVYSALATKGWEVHKQVGCARYRIDLAVVDPERPGRYLLGVECDGANYHRAKTARDRDKLREAVLRDLGWELHRIWSTDWWASPERETEKIVEAISAAAEPGEEVELTALSDDRSSEDLRTEGESASGEIGEPPAAEEAEPDLGGELEGDGLVRYEITPPVATPRGTLDDFYEMRAAATIREEVRRVVEFEGPISLTLLSRRVAAGWGLERVRKKALRRIADLAGRAGYEARVSGGVSFYWPEGTAPESYTTFRMPAGADPPRAIEDICLEEIANVAIYILTDHLSAPREELVRGMSRILRYSRTGPLIHERCQEAIELLRRGNGIEIQDDIVTLAST